MSQVSQADTVEGGNTISPSTRSRAYTMTLNNYTDTEYKSMCDMGSDCVKYIIGKEVGENNTPHLQCYFQWKNATRFSTLKQKCPRAHIEVARGTPDQNFTYCSKDGDFVTNMTAPKSLKIISTLRPWQQRIVDIFNTEPDDRSINWWWEQSGNVGKSALCKYLAVKHGALILNGKASDIKYLIAKYWLEHKKPVDMPPMIFDFTRSQEQFISYQAMEEIKNGCFMSTKFECEMVIFNSPHIVIFANFEPLREKLSIDRWKIHEISVGDVVPLSVEEVVLEH